MVIALAAVLQIHGNTGHLDYNYNIQGVMMLNGLRESESEARTLKQRRATS